jgi:hypothetical protein
MQTLSTATRRSVGKGGGARLLPPLCVTTATDGKCFPDEECGFSVQKASGDSLFASLLIESFGLFPLYGVFPFLFRPPRVCLFCVPLCVCALSVRVGRGPAHA